MPIDDISRPMSDKEWRAREDALTLAKANRIADDPKRMSAAKQAAQQMAEEEKKDAAAMSKVANGKKPRMTGSVGNTNYNVFKNVTRKKNG